LAVEAGSGPPHEVGDQGGVGGDDADVVAAGVGAVVDLAAGPCRRGDPAGRLGEPAEVGQLVAFLASERVAHITGAVYQIDGGIIRSNL
jgi:NAD(P)-dependent dehydrogenase (short-subunit alcohol dehydrogenase family)